MFQKKDLAQVAHLRRKVAGHKLDYDCKKRHGTQGTDLVDAERKFADSYQVPRRFRCCILQFRITLQSAQLSMNSVIQNEQEYIMQVSALTSSLNVI